MIPDEKKQVEWLLMEYFRRSFAEFPKGKLLLSESPDFVLQTNHKSSIGIELTRLHPANHSGGFPGWDNRFAEESVIGYAKEMVERTEQRKFFVKFLFSDKEPVTASRVPAVAAQTARLVRQAALNANSGFFQHSVAEAELPAGVTSLLVMRLPTLQAGIWERANPLGVSGNTVDDIRHSIRKKEEKLTLYQARNLSQYWLLITTDRLRGIKNFNIENKITNHTFRSLFQRVFLFELLKGRVFQLV